MPAQIENVPSKRMLKPLILSIQQTKSKQMRPIFTQFLQAALGTYITFYTLHFIFANVFVLRTLTQSNPSKRQKIGLRER